MADDNRIVLVDEEGAHHTFTLYRIVEVIGRAYALLEPEEGDDELVILRIEGSIEEGNLVTLDDEEWDRVAAALEEEGLLLEDFEEEPGEE